MSGLARCQTRIASWGSRGVLSPTYLTISSRPLVTSHEQARSPRRHGTNQPDSPALPEPAGHRPEPSPALRTCARLRGRAVRAASRRDASRPNASRRGVACGSHVAQTAPFREGRGQNALFRRMHFSSPGQTRRRLTEKRILLAWGVAECAFRSRRRPRGAGRNPPPACGALWRMPQLGKRARATPRQAAGGVAPGFANLGLESDLTERRTLPNRWGSECAFP